LLSVWQSRKPPSKQMNMFIVLIEWCVYIVFLSIL
jgi:hypothetical protein